MHDSRTSDFDYDLPRELIAQQPLEPRDAARLLVLDRATRTVAHHAVRDLPLLLRRGDTLVVNRSRVIPARVHGRLAGGGRAEVLLLRRLEPGRWRALARPARRLRAGATISLEDGLTLRVTAVGEAGLRDLAVEGSARDLDEALLRQGGMPLPPYIRGWRGDPERYQTVYADVDGSAAAPTAGLHFTPELLERSRRAGIGRATVTLHVGLDTFRPVAVDDPSAHRMHAEWYEVPSETAAAVEATRARGGRVVAVGTTSVRALESWASTGSAEGWTRLFIRPGYPFGVVDTLLTNFHLPRSTLLMLVSAFAGRDLVLAAYAEAVRERYRFFSFGDAMLIL